MKKIIKKYIQKFGYKISKSSNLNKNDIAFLHIGKNGGTQIINIFSKLNDYRFNIKKQNHHIKLFDIPENCRYFFSIRKPVTRFVSGFYSRLRKGKPRIFVEWTDEEKFAFNNFKSANDLAESIFLDNENGEKARIAITSIGHISHHQIDWFKEFSFLENRPPLFIIRQEKLTDDINQLLRLLNVKEDAKNLVDENPIISHRNDYTYVQPLSDLAIKNLNKWYIRDNFFYNMCEKWINKKIHNTRL